MLRALTVLWCFRVCNGVLSKTGKGVTFCCCERRLVVRYHFKVVLVRMYTCMFVCMHVAQVYS